MSDVASAVEQPEPAPPQQAPTDLPDVDTLKAAPPADVDSLKPAPVLQNPRGPRGGLPDSAALRFGKSDAIANIFTNAATRYAKGWVNTFSDLNAQDQKTLTDYGYGNYSGPGALLQHFGDTINAGATLLKNGFLATVGNIPEALAGGAEQAGREAGLSETEAQRLGREGGLDTEAILADIGLQHGLAMRGAAMENMGAPARLRPDEVPPGGGEPPGGGGAGITPEAAAKAAAEQAQKIAAAKVQLGAPGVWGHASRLDQTPEGGLTHTPLGRLPSVDEAVGQAKTVADALHLPPSTADLIHQTYLDTGRPPAEVLMDAQSNHGGVLDDLVAGKVPTAYQPPTALPVIDTAEIGRLGREVSLNELDKNLTDQLEKLPAGDASAADRLNRLQTVEDQLKNEALTGPERKALLDRRDQILIDTNPEALKAAAQPLVDRRNLEAQRARVAEQLGDIERERRAAQTDVALGQGPNLQGGPSRPIDSEGPLMGTAEPTPTVAPEGRAAVETPPAKEATPAATTPAGETPAGATQALKATSAPVLRETLPGVSKIGQDIKQEAIERGIADDIEKTAGYTPRVVEEQKAKTLDLVANHFDDARAMLNGKKEIPSDVSPVMLLRALRNYARETKDANLYSEIANSPLVSGTSYAASETRLAAELGPDDPIAKLREIQQAQAKQAGGPKQIAARRAVVKEALPEADKILLPKEEQSWDRFLEAIKC